MLQSIQSRAAQLAAHRTLVLNRRDEKPLRRWPLSIWSWQDTLRALTAGNVDPYNMAQPGDLWVHGPQDDFWVPPVVVTREAIPPRALKRSQRSRMVPNLTLIYEREQGHCAYCGVHTHRDTYGELAYSATLDHVQPKSRGGPNTWFNLVLACQACNNRKGNQTPAEAGMILLIQPWRPAAEELLQLRMHRAPFQVEAWSELLAREQPSPRVQQVWDVLANLPAAA